MTDIPARLIKDLAGAGPVLTDGAWGTQLMAMGLPPGLPAERWNLTEPDRVEAVASSYVEAGSQVILTNTFQGNSLAVSDDFDRENLTEINRVGVEISKRAAAGRSRVFASMGPSGKLLATGTVDAPMLRDAFTEQAEALAAGHPDAIVIETMSDLTEARIALDAAKATRLPVVVCMVFHSGRNRDRTMLGVAPATAAEELTAAGADAVGANCGTGIEAHVPICAALASATHLPIWIKPNAGLPTLEEGRVVYHMTPEEFAAHVDQLVEGGADFVGGCCGTDPDFVAVMARHLAR